MYIKSLYKIYLFWYWSILPSILQNMIGPWNVMQLHNMIELPPNLSVCFNCLISQDCSSQIQHRLRLSKQNQFKFVSSEKMTYFQSLMVQCSCCLQNSSRSLMWLLFNFGLFCFTFYFNPAARKTLLTVSTLIVTWHSSHTYLVACVAISNPRDVTPLMDVVFYVLVNACGPPLLVGISNNLFLLSLATWLWDTYNSFATSLVDRQACNFTKMKLSRSIQALAENSSKYTMVCIKIHWRCV